MDTEFKSVNTETYLECFRKIFMANAYEFLEKSFANERDKCYKMLDSALSSVKIVAINTNGTIDIEGDLIVNFALEYLPDIRSLKGNFICCSNPYITTLEHSPSIVTGDFTCSNNPNLQSLEGSPKFVGGDFYCKCNPLLISTEGSPTTVRGHTSLEVNDN